MRAVVGLGLIVVAGVVLGVGCGGTSTGGGRTDGGAGTTLASGGTTSTGVGGAAGSPTTPSSGGTGAPSSGGSTADGGTGTGTGGAGAATVADLCPELVEADCSALATYLPDEATCASVLPVLSSLCQPAADNLLDCTGPDPDVTCTAAGTPTSAGCESEWTEVMVCVAQVMGGGAGG